MYISTTLLVVPIHTLIYSTESRPTSRLRTTVSFLFVSRIDLELRVSVMEPADLRMMWILIYSQAQETGLRGCGVLSENSPWQICHWTMFKRPAAWKGSPQRCRWYLCVSHIAGWTAISPSAWTKLSNAALKDMPCMRRRLLPHLNAMNYAQTQFRNSSESESLTNARKIFDVLPTHTLTSNFFAKAITLFGSKSNPSFVLVSAGSMFLNSCSGMPRQSCKRLLPIMGCLVTCKEAVSEISTRMFRDFDVLVILGFY